MQSNARHRHLIVTSQSARASTAQSDNTAEPPCAPMTWMARLNRVFGIDLSVCPKCGGKLRVIGEVTDPKTIARILEHACPRRGSNNASAMSVARAHRRCCSQAYSTSSTFQSKPEHAASRLISSTEQSGQISTP